MKFTLSWLKEHLKTDASLDDILYALTDLGLEVEDVVNPLDKLDDFTIGYVADAEKHPDADKLRVCKVNTDEGELQIICGAPNARKGIYVVVAKPGVYVPGLDITIGVGKIRGIESFGMMASEREMELSDEHDGIIELEGSPSIGSKFVDYLKKNKPETVDPIIEIAITPNRPDALGVRGIARDLAARGIGELINRDTEVEIDGKFSSKLKISIDQSTLNGCPLFVGRVIKGVKNGPSPNWLQTALRAIGLRPISLLVDITNYYTYDRNRPLHVFDMDKVSGNLRIHQAKGGETITALDDREYVMQKDMMVISDDNGIESIAGIMGGLNTGCDENTVNVFVELWASEISATELFKSDIEKVATIIQTQGGNKFNLPANNDTAVVAAILGEGTAESVSDMTFTNVEFDPYTYSSKIVKVSRQLVQDNAFDLGSFVAGQLANRLNRGINAHLTTGDNSGKPQGVVTGSTLGKTAASATAVTIAELLDLMYSVDVSYRNAAGAAFMMNSATFAAITKLGFGSSNDFPVVIPSMEAGAPDLLFGKPVYDNEDMAGIATGEKSVIFGDMKQYYIHQAGGVQLLRLEERYADELSVGYLAYKRIDGNVVQGSAIKHLIQA